MTTEQLSAPDSRVVVGVDGSEPSKHALRWAHLLARACGCTFEAVTAGSPTGYGLLGAGMTAMPSDSIRAQDGEKALTATVDEVFGEQRPAGLQLIVREGYAAPVLLRANQVGPHSSRTTRVSPGEAP